MFSLRSITLDGTDACTAVRSGKALSTLLTPGIQLRPKSSTRYSLVFSLECPAVDATTTGTGVPLGEVPSTLLTSRYPDYVLPITRTTYEKHKNQKHKCKGVGGMGGSPSINHPVWGTPIFGNTHIDWQHLALFQRDQPRCWEVQKLNNRFINSAESSRWAKLKPRHFSLSCPTSFPVQVCKEVMGKDMLVCSSAQSIRHHLTYKLYGCTTLGHGAHNDLVRPNMRSNCIYAIATKLWWKANVGIRLENLQISQRNAIHDPMWLAWI